MAPLIKPPSLGDLLKYELEPNFTRETVTLRAGAAYPLGAVLGLVATGPDAGRFAFAADEAETGETAAAAVLLEPVDTTDGERRGTVLRRGPAILSRAELVFDPSLGDESQRAGRIAELTDLGLVVRETA
ncbi:head decoration protein [Cereibacter sphaeroides]|uniref:Head decoration protein n=1 Tax=Cereibacter sphaeroides TaxID=1063 RepID=A0AAX1UF74_CERSP|nr:head decoration protein [Cereibacter sphaeroides]RHZ90998.1 head decoration protein [Cereibacter sphaeroides]